MESTANIVMAVLTDLQPRFASMQTLSEISLTLNKPHLYQ